LEGRLPEKLVSLEEMARQIRSGDIVGTTMGVSECSPDVYEAILGRAGELRGVKILSAVPVRPGKLHDPKFMANLDGHINYLSAFFSPSGRAQGQLNTADFLIVMSADIGENLPCGVTYSQQWLHPLIRKGL